MKRATVVLMQRVVCAVCVTAAACRSSTEAPAASTPPPNQLLIAAQAQLPTCAQPGEVLSPAPAVVVTDRQGRPASQIFVTFSAGAGEQIQHATATTDVYGVASAGSWRLADVPGLNTMVASLQGGPSTTLGVITQAGARIIAAFDLLSVGGRPLPDKELNATVTAGHWFLAEGGTYDQYRELNGQGRPLPLALCPAGARYVITDSIIDFFFMPGNIHFATATMRGDTLAMKYGDLFEFEDELYVLRTGSVPRASADRAAPAPGLLK